MPAAAAGLIAGGLGADAGRHLVRLVRARRARRGETPPEPLDERVPEAMPPRAG